MLCKVCDERIDVVSESAGSSVAVLGELTCLVGRLGDVGVETSDPVGGIGSPLLEPGGFGMKTVLRTSRRPRMVPAFRLTPLC